MTGSHHCPCNHSGSQFKPEGVVLPNDAPSYLGYPPGLVVKLVASRVAMLLGR